MYRNIKILKEAYNPDEVVHSKITLARASVDDAIQILQRSGKSNTKGYMKLLKIYEELDRLHAFSHFGVLP